jgi:hypothetical protein
MEDVAIDDAVAQLSFVIPSYRNLSHSDISFRIAHRGGKSRDSHHLDFSLSACSRPNSLILNLRIPLPPHFFPCPSFSPRTFYLLVETYHKLVVV